VCALSVYLYVHGFCYLTVYISLWGNLHYDGLQEAEARRVT